ncbi:MAG: peroxiredoxin [Bacteroidetes bacterium HGW-Bacteroidetes-13]|nr:MAG: peroxiredoxin [Bacteroidetes bacterium HGW-Bacteroidetes-13]
MKKLSNIFTTFVLLLIISCHKNDGYQVNIDVQGAENGTKAYLLKYEDQVGVMQDSALIENNKVVFEGQSTDSEFYFIQFENKGGALLFLLENAEIQIKVHADSLFKASIEGTKTNEELVAYRNKMNEYNHRQSEIFEQSRSLSEMDTVLINGLQATYDRVSKEAKAYELNYIKSHPDSYLSTLIIQELLSFNDISPNEAVALTGELSERIRKSKIGKSLENQLSKLASLEVGAIAPDFVGPTPDGGALKLNQVKGKITILDFWASWCTPCRAENPSLAAFYETMHPEGLEIISIALDRNSEDWKTAIKEDGMPWLHVSNLMFWEEPIARLYNVMAIPQTFILDENKNILATDLRGEELRAFVEERLAERN